VAVAIHPFILAARRSAFAGGARCGFDQLALGEI
jgi:hypothetical protein